MVSDHGPWDKCTLFQPALTLVNRQVRAEALPIYYGENTLTHKVYTHSAEQWTGSVRKMITSFIGDTGSLPGPSSLRHLNNLNLMLKADQLIPPVQIKIEMMSYALSPEERIDEYKDEMKDPELWSRWDEIRKRVRIGTTELNWTDHEAVRVAFNKATCRLGGNLAEMEVFLDFELSSTTSDYRSALDVVRMLASACPRLTKSVFVRDCTEPERSVPRREELSDLYVGRFWR